MAEYGVTEQGFNMKRFDVLLKEVQSELTDALGFDVSQNPQSLLNSALIIPFVDKIATLWEVAQDSYYAKFPSTAEGINLDNACQYGGVFREGNRPTKYVIHCRSVENTDIPAGSLIQSTTNPPVKLSCITSVTSSRSACNVIAVRPVQVEATTYQITINGMYTATYTADSEDTLQTICEGLRDSLIALIGTGTDAEFEVTISEENDFVLIKDNTLSRTDSFVLSNSLTTEYVVSLVEYNTEEYGDIYCPYGSITTIVTNVPGETNQHNRSGMFKISNLLEPTPGRLQQEDWEYRQSYLKKSYINSFGMTDSIDSYILDNVDGVTSVRTFENATDDYVPPEAESDPTIPGRPPHSIEVVVYGEGFDQTKVAQCIWDKKAAGIQTYGRNQHVEITGTYGDVVTVNFTTPEAKLVWLKIQITSDGSAMPEDYQAQVISSIISETRSLEVGQTLKIQTLIDNVYSVLDGVAFCRITAATGDNPQPTDYAEQNILAGETEVLKLSSERIDVGLLV